MEKNRRRDGGEKKKKGERRGKEINNRSNVNNAEGGPSLFRIPDPSAGLRNKQDLLML